MTTVTQKADHFRSTCLELAIVNRKRWQKKRKRESKAKESTNWDDDQVCLLVYTYTHKRREERKVQKNERELTIDYPKWKCVCECPFLVHSVYGLSFGRVCQ